MPPEEINTEDFQNTKIILFCGSFCKVLLFSLSKDQEKHLACTTEKVK